MRCRDLYTAGRRPPPKKRTNTHTNKPQQTHPQRHKHARHARTCALVGIWSVRRSQTRASGVGSPWPAGPLAVGSFCCSSGMLYPRKRMPWGGWGGWGKGGAGISLLFIYVCGHGGLMIGWLLNPKYTKYKAKAADGVVLLLADDGPTSWASRREVSQKRHFTSRAPPMHWSTVTSPITYIHTMQWGEGRGGEDGERVNSVVCTDV